MIGQPLPEAKQPTPNGHGVGLLPANWWQVAAANGHDPQEVAFQRDTYGWGVGTHIAYVPPQRVKLVDARFEIAAGYGLISIGIILCCYRTLTEKVTKP